MRILSFDNRQAWQTKFLDLVSENKPQTIGLSGGSAVDLYPAMASLGAMPSLFLCDERFVSIDNQNSNYHLIKTRTKNLLPLQAWNTSLEWQECVINYAKKLPTKLDLAILGIGPDGHFASVFPKDEDIWRNQNKTAATITTQWAIKNRLTLTPNYLAKSKLIIVLIQGKQAVVNELQNPTKTKLEFPAHFLRELENCLVLYLA